MSFLFDEIIFGPVRSRRFGVSLGINVIPSHQKICTFNCIYCECGWTEKSTPGSVGFNSRADIRLALETKLQELGKANIVPDALTFAGNGEPTLHPDFAAIIDDTLELRNQYFPTARVVVLSNSSLLYRDDVFQALLKVENIMKLDAGSEDLFQKINGPRTSLHLTEIVDQLVRFQGNLIIQTLFLKATIKEVSIDNTTDEEVKLWLGHLERIKPALVMIYPIDRPAPDGNIEKLSQEVLNKIGEKVRAIGLKANIYS